MAVSLVRRGDVILTSFGPAREGEANLVHPAVVVTNNFANAQAPVLMVVPITSNLERVYVSDLLLPVERSGLNKDSKAQVALMQAVNVNRLLKKISFIPDDLMLLLDEKIRIHLSLENLK
jgi:mRNA interferase MazF